MAAREGGAGSDVRLPQESRAARTKPPSSAKRSATAAGIGPASSGFSGDRRTRLATATAGWWVMTWPSAGERSESPALGAQTQRRYGTRTAIQPNRSRSALHAVSGWKLDLLVRDFAASSCPARGPRTSRSPPRLEPDAGEKPDTDSRCRGASPPRDRTRRSPPRRLRDASSISTASNASTTTMDISARTRSLRSSAGSSATECAVATRSAATAVTSSSPSRQPKRGTARRRRRRPARRQSPPCRRHHRTPNEPDGHCALRRGMSYGLGREGEPAYGPSFATN
jgi:hypothetical protein